MNRTDEGTANNQEIGTYEPVSYSDWKPSKDGYYYFRGTDEVEEFVGDRPEDAYKGVILVNILCLSDSDWSGLSKWSR